MKQIVYRISSKSSRDPVKEQLGDAHFKQLERGIKSALKDLKTHFNQRDAWPLLQDHYTDQILFALCGPIQSYIFGRIVEEGYEIHLGDKNLIVSAGKRGEKQLKARDRRMGGKQTPYLKVGSKKK